jgi:hypothetical protein
MTGYQWQEVQWQEVLIAIAGALLLTSLVLIAVASLVLSAVTARGRNRAGAAQMAAAYRRFSSGDALPGRNRRQRPKLVVLVLVILNLVSLGILLARPGELAAESTSTQSATPGALSSSATPSSASDPRSTPTSTTTPGADGNTGSSSTEEKIIRLEASADSARPFQPVRVQGTYEGGAETYLRVQRLEGGFWLDFPLPSMTDQSGRFTTYVELGKPGSYRLRVLDPSSGVTSKPFVLVISR